MERKREKKSENETKIEKMSGAIKWVSKIRLTHNSKHEISDSIYLIYLSMSVSPLTDNWTKLLSRSLEVKNKLGKPNV